MAKVAGGVERQFRTFATTHWSVVLTAGQAGQPGAAEALAHLCQIYWFPLYAYVRRRGYAPAEAEDLTQGFFLHLLESDAVRIADRGKGRFRSFLLTSLNHYLLDAKDRARAQKRGGGSPVISIDAASAEERYQLEPPDEHSPDRLFERQWALALFDEVLRRLERAEAESGRGTIFQQLREYVALSGNGRAYAQAALELHMSEDGVKKAVQRLRRRYQQLFREEILQTLENPADLEAEIRYLCEVVARR